MASDNYLIRRISLQTVKVLALCSSFVLGNCATTEENTLKKPILKYPFLLDEYMRGILNVYCIVPDILSEAPKHVIKVQYTELLEIEFSRVFFARDLEHQPELLKWEGPPRSYFTVLMIGLANPTLDDFNTYEWLHWMVANIYGAKSSPRNKTLVEYVPPHPEEKKGMYRYIFLVYLQPNKIKFPDKPPLKRSFLDRRRANFSCAKFSRKYNLGKPLGINFFQSEFWHKNDSKTNFSIYDPTPGTYWMSDLEDYVENSLD